MKLVLVFVLLEIMLLNINCCKMKKINYVVLSIVVIVAASCTMAVYFQKNNQNSTQKVESSSSVSADSASVSVDFPKE